MPKIEGKIQGKSSSGKAYRINGKWVAISQLTDIKIEGENISAEIPGWLLQKLTGEKPKAEKTYSKSASNKYVKSEKTYVEDKKDYIPLQIYTNCTRCNKVGFISAKSKLCVCCMLDIANRNTASDRAKLNKIVIDKLYKESEADKAKWRQHYAEKEQEYNQEE